LIISSWVPRWTTFPLSRTMIHRNRGWYLSRWAMINVCASPATYVVVDDLFGIGIQCTGCLIHYKNGRINHQCTGNFQRVASGLRWGLLPALIRMPLYNRPPGMRWHHECRNPESLDNIRSSYGIIPHGLYYFTDRTFEEEYFLVNQWNWIPDDILGRTGPLLAVERISPAQGWYKPGNQFCQGRLPGTRNFPTRAIRFPVPHAVKNFQ